MKRSLTKLTAAGLAVLALTGCTGGVPEEVSEEPCNHGFPLYWQYT